MLKTILIKLSIITILCCAATVINIAGQTRDDASAKSSPTTQAADEVCNQRLAKTLDALEAAELTVKLQQAALEAQQKLAEANEKIIAKKDEIIENQADLLKIYEKEKGVTVSFFFGLLKIRKR
jgi:phage-related minor tail protein